MKLSKGFNFNLFSPLRKVMHENDVQLLYFFQEIASVCFSRNLLPPLSLKESFPIRNAKIHMTSAQFSYLPCLDDNRQRGCRILLLIVQNERILCSTMQNGPGLQWIEHPSGILQISDPRKLPVTMSGLLILKFYHIPEDFGVLNPRILIAKFHLHTSVIVIRSELIVESLNSPEIPNLLYSVTRKSLISSEISNRLHRQFQIRLNFFLTNEAFTSSNPLDFIATIAEDSQPLCSAGFTNQNSESKEQYVYDPQNTSQINEDELCAQKLEAEFEEEELRQLAEIISRSANGINLIDLSHRLRGLDSSHTYVGSSQVSRRIPRADQWGLPFFTCETNSKFLSEFCVICHEQFALGETLRLLPCLHPFHQICVDKWLENSAECPICLNRVDI